MRSQPAGGPASGRYPCCSTTATPPCHPPPWRHSPRCRSTTSCCSAASHVSRTVSRPAFRASPVQQWNVLPELIATTPVCRWPNASEGGGRPAAPRNTKRRWSALRRHPDRASQVLAGRTPWPPVLGAALPTALPQDAAHLYVPSRRSREVDHPPRAHRRCDPPTTQSRFFSFPHAHARSPIPSTTCSARHSIRTTSSVRACKRHRDVTFPGSLLLPEDPQCSRLRSSAARRTTRRRSSPSSGAAAPAALASPFLTSLDLSPVYATAPAAAAVCVARGGYPDARWLTLQAGDTSTPVIGETDLMLGGRFVRDADGIVRTPGIGAPACVATPSVPPSVIRAGGTGIAGRAGPNTAFSTNSRDRLTQTDPITDDRPATAGGASTSDDASNGGTSTLTYITPSPGTRPLVTRQRRQHHVGIAERSRSPAGPTFPVRSESTCTKRRSRSPDVERYGDRFERRRSDP